MNGLTKTIRLGEKIAVHSMDKGMKTNKELMAEILHRIQQTNRELAAIKYMPYYREYLALGEEICAALSFQRLLHHQVWKLA